MINEKCLYEGVIVPTALYGTDACCIVPVCARHLLI